MTTATSNRPRNAEPVLDNRAIANHFDEVAELLEAQAANPYRVQAYRNAARMLRNLRQPVRDVFEAEGEDGLKRLPGIGVSLARSMELLLDTGRLGLLEQLRGDASPERILATVPGIGLGLAGRIHEQLGIETLLELEGAAYDGRLEQVPGFGRKRIRGVRESLAGRFRRRPRLPERAVVRPPKDQPSVAELLDVDRAYREKVMAGRLPRIAPRRFNPTGVAWLPILHTKRAERHYTALYSNTARAHERGMIHDWVVIYRDDHKGHGQWTIITAQFGPLRGRRIIRGREHECQAYYAKHESVRQG